MIENEKLWWVPVVAVLAMTALGLLAATGRAPDAARRGWMLALLIAGIAAVAVTAWQEAASGNAPDREAARLAEIGNRLDQLGKSLPQVPGGNPAATFDTVPDAIHSLNARIDGLQEQIRAAQDAFRRRRIDPDIASQLVAHLRGLGSYRVVVSTVPGDPEAFGYATQFLNILREAGWDAHGPETTAIFGTAPYPGVTLFAPSGGAAAQGMSVLLNAFTRFNIPYRSGIPPREAIPDPATISLFVSGKS